MHTIPNKKKNECSTNLIRRSSALRAAHKQIVNGLHGAIHAHLHHDVLVVALHEHVLQQVVLGLDLIQLVLWRKLENISNAKRVLRQTTSINQNLNKQFGPHFARATHSQTNTNSPILASY